MNKLTLNQVQELYYTEKARFDDDEELTPFDAINERYLPKLNKRKRVRRMDNFIRKASPEILDWIYDVSGAHLLDVFAKTDVSDYAKKYFQKYIDDKLFKNLCSYTDISAFVKSMNKHGFAYTLEMYQSIALRRQDKYLVTPDREPYRTTMTLNGVNKFLFISSVIQGHSGYDLGYLFDIVETDDNKLYDAINRTKEEIESYFTEWCVVRGNQYAIIKSE